MVGHHALIHPLVVVDLVGPPERPEILLGVDGCHPHIVGPSTLWSARLTDQVVDLYISLIILFRHSILPTTQLYLQYKECDGITQI